MGSRKVPLNDEPRDDTHGVEALWQLVKLARSSGLQQEAAFRERKELLNGKDGLNGDACAVGIGSCLSIRNVAHQAGATDVVKYFEEHFSGCRILECKLYASKTPRQHVGAGEVHFALQGAARRLLEQSYWPDRDRFRALSAPSTVGRSSELRIREHRPKRGGRDKLQGQMFTALKLEMGNLIGSSHKFTVVRDLPVALQVDMRGRVIIFEFEHAGQLYRVEMRLKEIAGRALLHTDRETHFAALVIPVKVPPRIYRLRPGFATSEHDYCDYMPAGLPGGQRGQTRNYYTLRDSSDWLRTTDFTPQAAFGRSFAYRVVLDCPSEDMMPGGCKRHLLDRLRQCRILSDDERWDVCAVTPAPSRGYLADHLLAGVPFQVRYHLDCLLTQGLVSDAQLDVGFCARVLSKDTPQDVAVGALALILAAKARVPDLEKEFIQLRKPLLEKYDAGTPIKREVPEYCMRVGRVLVTPTRVVCLAPEIDQSNRVVRQYRAHEDRFLRVTFCEENGARICYASDMLRLHDVMDRIEWILKKGLDVAGRHFDLLAFSSGQVREQSCWFWSAPEGGPTAADIRAGLGDFDHIRCVAKFTARVGQCFSSTVDTLKLLSYSVQTVPDVTRNGYCFSDGVGRISKGLCGAVAARLIRLGRCPPDCVPSALQIRYAGCKGMVSLHPDLCGMKLEVRPSMSKFEAESQMLEVCAVASYVPGYLNRQIITILMDKCLGIPDTVFQRLQDEMLQDLDGMISDPAIAIKVLKEYGGGDAAIMREAQKMIKAGFDVRTEPYLHNILLCLRAHLLQDLKAKTRIRVPQAALLLGVMDEMGVLECGQVFVSINPAPGQELPTIITGTVIVAKNPCFHPGDLRKLQAVDRPVLQHLVNCVVFPQRGERPHPDECSGSDLDGDQYFVSWDPRLIFPGPSRPPMHFHKQPPVLIPDRQARVEIQDVAQFFIDYIHNDLLGIIANAHLATADIEPDGARSPRCLALAALHSDAVDFTKCGRAVDLPRELRAASYPDFTMKKHGERHTSATIIGQLFHAVRVPKPPLLSNIINETCLYFEEPDPDISMDGFQDLIPEAQETRARYEHSLVQIMNQYGVHNEAEVVSGCISKFAKHRRKKGDVKQMVMEAVHALRKKFLKEFEERTVAEAEDVHAAYQRALQRACAWYHVTYSPKWSGYDSAAALSTRELDARLISFPWILTDYLAAIKSVAG